MTKLSEITGDTSSGGGMRLSQVDAGFKGEEPTAMEKTGAVARGVAAGTLGGLGDIEYFATTTVPKFFGGKGETGDFMGSPTFFPRSEDVEKGFQQVEKAVGAKPGVRPEQEGYRTGGEFVGGLVTPGQIVKNVIKKPLEKGMEIVSKARGKPLEKALSEMTTTAEELGKKASTRIEKTEKVGQEKIYTDQQRQEINLRDAAKRFDADAQLAKAESQSSLNKIGRPTNEYQVGEGLRGVAKGVEKQLDVARGRAADVLKDAYFAEGKASEAAGKFWSQSQTGQAFLKNLKDIASPANAGKYTASEQLAAKDLMETLSGVQVQGKIVRSQIEKIEKVIRETKKIANKPTMTGADAMKQQYMGKLAEKLEDSVYGYVSESGKPIAGFAPTGRTFREVYAKMSGPLNTYESQVGKVLTQEIEGLKGVFQADATQIPAKVFQSPEQVRILEKMDISKKTLEPFAAQHAANELSKLNTAEAVDAWINSSKGSYLQEFPAVAAKVKEYAKTLATNEVKAAEKSAGAKALSQRAKEISQRAQGKAEKLTDLTKENQRFVSESSRDIFNATTTDRSISAAETYVKGLERRGLATREETVAMLDKIRNVKSREVDKAKAIVALKGILPYVGATVGGGAVAGYSLNKLLGGF